MRGSTAGAIAGLVFAAASTVSAQSPRNYDTWEADFDDEQKSWQEVQTQIPAYPKTDTLRQVRVGHTSSHRYYLDASSLALGKDGVMRYSVVTKTTGGATNVSFEGIRCETRERKVYAFGHNDGTWARARDPKWRWIERNESPAFHYTLYRDYFCPARTIPTKPAQVIEAIKRGTPVVGGPTTVN